MHNPASDLLALFDTWTSNGGSASNQVDVRDEAGWETVATGFALLDEIAFTLKRAETNGMTVSAYLSVLPEWRASLLNYDRSWPQQPIQLRQRPLLEALVALFQMNPVPTLAHVNQADLRARLDEFVRFVVDDETLDQALRQYVQKLIAHVRHLLDLDRAGADLDLATCLGHLKFCFDAASAQTTSEESKSTFRDAAAWLRDQILAPSTAGALGGLLGSALPALGA